MLYASSLFGCKDIRVTDQKASYAEIDEQVMQAMRECTHQTARFHGEDEQGVAGVSVGATCVAAECGLPVDRTLEVLERLVRAGRISAVGAIEHGGEPHYVLARHLR
jgi:aryl-alcohol dehydrogenase-like predicted oxidoreductase